MLKYEMTSETGYRGIISASVQIHEDEEASGSSDGEGELSDASQMGSSLTVKYKGARSPSSAGRQRDPSSVPLAASQSDNPSTSSSARAGLMASITLKEKKSDSESGAEKEEKAGTKGRSTVCLGLMGFLSVAVVAGVGLGALYFSNARNLQWMRSAQASSSLTAENDQLIFKEGEAACRTVPASDYHSGLFAYGYDVTRARPLRKALLDTPASSALVRDDGPLHECHLMSEQSGECQLSAQSRVIDSLSAYYEWIGDRLDDGDEGVGVKSHAALATSSHDRDLLAIQADLMSGFVIVISSLNCPTWNVTRSSRPRLDPHFVQRLTLMADEDAELLEDFGTHYVEQAIVGGQAVILYSMDRKSIERLKAKNVSLSVQASTASLYLYSRSSGVNFSEKSAELALDFLSFAKTQLFDDSNGPVPIIGSTNDGQLIHAALKSNGIINLKMRPLEELFSQLASNGARLIDYWQRIRSVLCGRLLTPRSCPPGDTEVGRFGNEKSDSSSVHVLPLLSMATNGTNSVLLRASWSRCMELCREDPLCSSVTVCTSDGGSYNGPSVGCPVEFGASNCALHRQQEFQNGIVTPGVSTLVPIRRDLRPVTVRGFAVHGHPLVSSKQLTDLASCARLCSRTPDCRVVSFSQHSTGHKSCRLFHNVTMNELRVQGHSTLVFMMATFGPCFSGEEAIDRGVCPLHAECSPLYGMCVCPSGNRKSGDGCIAPDRINDQVEEPLVKKAHHTKKHRSHSANNVAVTTSTASPGTTITTTEETTTSTQASSTTAKVVHTRLQTSSNASGTKSSTENYYIRGVFIASETSTVSPKTTTTYKPWQMRFGIGPPVAQPSKQTSTADVSSPETALKLESPSNKHWNPRG